MPTVLKRCDKFVADEDPAKLVPMLALKFDVLAEVFELLQIGGGFEWSKSKYSRPPGGLPPTFCIDCVDVGDVMVPLNEAELL